MLNVVLSGLAAGLTYALLAAGLVMIQVAWLGVRPAEKDGPAALDLAAAALLGLLPAWLVRFLLQGVGASVPLVPALAWPFLPALIPLLALVWLQTGLGRVWRALVESRDFAQELGLPIRRASISALLLAVLLAVASGLLSASAGSPTVPPPELRALAAVLAAGAGQLLLAVVLAFCAGLAEGLAGLALDARFAELAGFAFFLLVAVRPRPAPTLRDLT